MSIRRINKNHLKQHGGVQSVAPERYEAPIFDDPLIFWTRHPKTPRKVDLRPFANGQAQSPTGHKKFKPFSGRPELIMQLLPALKESMLYVSEQTTSHYLDFLRIWWRLLDDVEESAAKTGKSMSRVTDVSLLTNVHAAAAHRMKMNRVAFSSFRSIVDKTRIALGANPTFWETPERDTPEKHIPPEDQRKALRIEIKRQCHLVIAHWALCDRLKALDTEPSDPMQAALWRAVQHLHNIQQKTGKKLPSGHELNNEKSASWTYENLGVGVKAIRATAFPNHRDACAVFTQCLINTAWNSSTMLTLDVSKRFLFDHFKDDAADPHRRWVLAPEVYTLVGEKERANGKEQFVTGMWKTRYGAGSLIRTYLARVEPLRVLLKGQLAIAKQQYLDAQEARVSPDEASARFAQIKLLEQGVKSIWLYVGQKGEIAWLDQQQACSDIDGKQVVYLDEVRHHLNATRAQRNEKPIPKVRLQNFRVWYADYAYRSHFGSILAVQKELNHSQLRTSATYINTNILNQEASNSARSFLDILLNELDKGRVDLTILAHLHRHGPLTPKQERQLAELRALPKSRQGVGCRDAYHPPAHMNAAPDEACNVQRCLLCVENAVLLPESLDGIAMREVELRALQGFVAATIWVTKRYDIELENQRLALRHFDQNEVMAARKKWVEAIVCGRHIVPGIPPEEVPSLMELA